MIDTTRDTVERIAKMLADDPKSTAFGVRASDLRDLLAEVARLREALRVIGHCTISCGELMDMENRRHARKALEPTT